MSSLGSRKINKQKPTSRLNLEKFLNFKDKDQALTVSGQEEKDYLQKS